jgi:hypothetical protein
MFAAHNMVDLVGKPGIVFLDAAVFTAILSAPGYFGSDGCRNTNGHFARFAGPWLSPFLECALTP